MDYKDKADEKLRDDNTRDAWWAKHNGGRKQPVNVKTLLAFQMI